MNTYIVTRTVTFLPKGDTSASDYYIRARNRHQARMFAKWRAERLRDDYIWSYSIAHSLLGDDNPVDVVIRISRARKVTRPILQKDHDD